MPPRQSFVHGRNNGFVVQHPVGLLHPVFVKIAHFRGDQSVAEAELCPSHLNHAASSPALVRRDPAAADRDLARKSPLSFSSASVNCCASCAPSPLCSGVS